jgi:hypothetical protein
MPFAFVPWLLVELALFVAVVLGSVVALVVYLLRRPRD